MTFDILWGQMGSWPLTVDLDIDYFLMPLLPWSPCCHPLMFLQLLPWSPLSFRSQVLMCHPPLGLSSQDSLPWGTRVCMIPPVVHEHCLRGAQTWDRLCTSSCCWARKTCLCFYPAYLLCLCACSIVPVDFSLTKCKFRKKVIKDFKIATVEH